MRPLRVAALDEELPFPATSGKRIRTFNLLSRLAERHRVTLLCHRNPDRDEAAAAEKAFRQLGIETVIVDRSVPSKSGPVFYAARREPALAAAVLRGLALEPGSRGRRPTVRRQAPRRCLAL